MLNYSARIIVPISSRNKWRITRGFEIYTSTLRLEHKVLGY